MGEVRYSVKQLARLAGVSVRTLHVYDKLGLLIPSLRTDAGYRYYGETEDLLLKYAWYQKNSQDKTWSVGSLKPNDLGLFDVQGNVYTWCQESYKVYPRGKSEGVADDQEDGLVVDSTYPRVLRGCSFFNQASVVRSADRLIIAPTIRFHSNGFRLARTISP